MTGRHRDKGPEGLNWDNEGPRSHRTLGDRCGWQSSRDSDPASWEQGSGNRNKAEAQEPGLGLWGRGWEAKMQRPDLPVPPDGCSNWWGPNQELKMGQLRTRRDTSCSGLKNQLCLKPYIHNYTTNFKKLIGHSLENAREPTYLKIDQYRKGVKRLSSLSYMSCIPLSNQIVRGSFSVQNYSS